MINSMERLRRDFARRAQCDFKIDYALNLLLSLLTCMVWTLVVSYRSVRRRDLHFVRSADFAADALLVVREQAEATGRRSTVEGHLGTLDVIARDLRTQSGERGALLWTLL